MGRFAQIEARDGTWTYGWLNESYMNDDPEPGMTWPMGRTYGTNWNTLSDVWETFHYACYTGHLYAGSGFHDADTGGHYTSNAAYSSLNGYDFYSSLALDASVYPGTYTLANIIVPNYDPDAWTLYTGGSTRSPQISWIMNGVGDGINGRTWYVGQSRGPFTIMFNDTIPPPPGSSVWTYPSQDGVGAWGWIIVGPVHSSLANTPIHVDLLALNGSVIATAELGYHTSDGDPPATTTQLGGRFHSEYVEPTPQGGTGGFSGNSYGGTSVYGGSQIWWYEGRCAGFRVRKEGGVYPNDCNPAGIHMGGFGKKISPGFFPPLRWNQRNDGAGIIAPSARISPSGAGTSSSVGTSNRLPIGQNIYE